MDDLHRRAVVRGATTFLAVAIVGSALVRFGDAAGETASSAPTPAPSVSVAPAEPLGWLTWVPGGLPDGFGDLLGTVPEVAASTTAASGIGWLTASFDAEGDGVDQPRAPMMIPLDVTAVDPTFAAFVPQPERQLLQNLRTGEAILSERAAQLRGLGAGSTLVFDGGEQLTVIGTLPDVLMGGHEVLVTRDTGRRVGVATDRYAIFHVRPTEGVRPGALIDAFRELLPADTPYPAIEVRAPGETTFLRANDRSMTPLQLKRAFGEFQAHPDERDGDALVIDPGWIQDHVRSAALPLLGTVTCHTRTLAALRRAMTRLEQTGATDVVHDVGPCFDPVSIASGPDGLLAAAAWGAGIEINLADNAPGDRPSQPAPLLRELRRAGFAWGGTDAYPQGASFRPIATERPTD